jgi:formylglycine-generating enzyme required for sulfatase activity
MPWPTSQEYNEAIQCPQTSFADAELRAGQVATNALGLPMPCSGNFADVYQFRCSATDRTWAVKCFTRQIPGLRQRYREISQFLEQARLPFMVDFTFLDQGIRIQGDWFPILKMQWVEGFTLNQFVKEHLDKPQVLESLCQIWLKLSRKLREASLAHCDLQHGNVLLVPGSKATSLGVRLVDYDGMCVPALAMQKSHESGHPAYQHPQRLRDGTYNLAVDRFPHLVIYTALRSLLVGGKPLWDRYDSGDNLLFTQKDFEAPERSALFQELQKLGDPQVRKLSQTLADAARQPLKRVPVLDEMAMATTSIIREVSGAESQRRNQFESITESGTLVAFPPRPRKSRKKLLLGLAALACLAGLFLIGGVVALAVALSSAKPTSTERSGGDQQALESKSKGSSSEAPAASSASAPKTSGSVSRGSPASSSSGSGQAPPPVVVGSGSPGSGSSSAQGSESSAGSPPVVPIAKRPEPIDLELADGVVLKLVPIPAKGKKFWMGAADKEVGKRAEERQHEVEFGHDYLLGMYLVTQAQYRAVTNKNPSHFSEEGTGAGKVKGLNTDDFPVEKITWDEAMAFCAELTRKFKDKGYQFRLPTEAEWEYACRAGDDRKDSAPFYFKERSFTVDGTKANFRHHETAQTAYLDRTSKVGAYEANGFGLFDMHGNVWEWCEDWYDPDFYKNSPGVDPSCDKENAKNKGRRVVRGGAWNLPAEPRAASRDGCLADGALNTVGFRVCALTAGSTSTPVVKVPESSASPSPPETTPAAASKDRAVAEWAIGKGGIVAITRVSGSERPEFMKTVADLPREPFNVASLTFEAKCKLVDNDLKRLAGLDQLDALGFVNLPITDAGLSHLKELPRLRSLHLLHAQVTADGLPGLKGLPELRDLSLSGNPINDKALKSLGQIEKLAILDLSSTQITNEGTANLKGLKLNSLVLDNNTTISDACIPHLLELKTLKLLQLVRTKLTKAGIEALQKGLPDAKVVH